MRKSLVVIISFLLLVAFTSFFASSIGWYQVNTNNDQTVTNDLSNSSLNTKKYYSGYYLMAASSSAKIKGVSHENHQQIQYYDKKISDELHTMLYEGDEVLIRYFSTDKNEWDSGSSTSVVGKSSYSGYPNYESLDYFSIDDSTNGVITIEKGGWYTFNGTNTNTSSASFTISVDYYVSVETSSNVEITYPRYSNYGVSGGGDNSSSVYKIPALKTSEGINRTIFYIASGDSADWDSYSAYYWGSTKEIAWPGVLMEDTLQTYDGNKIYFATIPADVTGVVFNNTKASNSSDKRQAGDLTGANLISGFTVGNHTAFNYGNQVVTIPSNDDSYSTVIVSNASATRSSKLTDYFTYSTYSIDTSTNNVYRGYEADYDNVHSGIDNICDGFNDAAENNSGYIKAKLSYYEKNAAYLVGTINGQNQWNTSVENYNKFDSNKKLSITLYSGDIVKVRLFCSNSHNNEDIYIPSTWDNNEYKVWNDSYKPYHWWYKNFGWDKDGNQLNWNNAEVRANLAAYSSNYNGWGANYAGQWNNLVITHTGLYEFEIDNVSGAVNVSYYGDVVYFKEAAGAKLTHSSLVANGVISDKNVRSHNSNDVYYSYFGGATLSTPPSTCVDNAIEYSFSGWYGYISCDSATPNCVQFDGDDNYYVYKELLSDAEIDQIYRRQRTALTPENGLVTRTQDFIYAESHKAGTFLLGKVQNAASAEWKNDKYQLSTGSLNSSSSSSIIYLNSGDEVKARDYTVAGAIDGRYGHGWYNIVGTFDGVLVDGHATDAYGNYRNDDGNYVVATAGYYRIIYGTVDNAGYTRTMRFEKVYKITLSEAIASSNFTTLPNATTSPSDNSYFEASSNGVTSSMVTSDNYTCFFILSNEGLPVLKGLNSSSQYATENVVKQFVTFIDSDKNSVVNTTTDRSNVVPFHSVSGIFLAGNYSSNTKVGVLDQDDVLQQASASQAYWYSQDNINLSPNNDSSILDSNKYVYLEAGKLYRVVNYANNYWYPWGSTVDDGLNQANSDGTNSGNDITDNFFGNAYVETSGWYKFTIDNNKINVTRYYKVDLYDSVSFNFNQGNIDLTGFPADDDQHKGTFMFTYNQSIDAGRKASYITRFEGWYTTVTGTTLNPTFENQITNVTSDTIAYSKYVIRSFYIFDTSLPADTTTYVAKATEATEELTEAQKSVYYQAKFAVTNGGLNPNKTYEIRYFATEDVTHVRREGTLIGYYKDPGNGNNMSGGTSNSSNTFQTITAASSIEVYLKISRTENDSTNHNILWITDYYDVLVSNDDGSTYTQYKENGSRTSHLTDPSAYCRISAINTSNTYHKYNASGVEVNGDEYVIEATSYTYTIGDTPFTKKFFFRDGKVYAGNNDATSLSNAVSQTDPNDYVLLINLSAGEKFRIMTGANTYMPLFVSYDSGVNYESTNTTFTASTDSTHIVYINTVGQAFIVAPRIYSVYFSPGEFSDVWTSDSKHIGALAFSNTSLATPSPYHYYDYNNYDAELDIYNFTIAVAYDYIVFVSTTSPLVAGNNYDSTVWDNCVCQTSDPAHRIEINNLSNNVLYYLDQLNVEGNATAYKALGTYYSTDRWIYTGNDRAIILEPNDNSSQYVGVAKLSAGEELRIATSQSNDTVTYESVNGYTTLNQFISGDSKRLYFNNSDNWSNVYLYAYSNINVESSSENNIVYFANTGNWSNVYIHYWNANNSTEWPGNQMKKLNGTSNVYYLELSFAPTKLIFSDGTYSNRTNPSNTEYNVDFNNGKLFTYNGYDSGNWKGSWSSNNYSLNNVSKPINAKNATWPGVRIDNLSQTVSINGTAYMYYDLANTYEYIVFNNGTDNPSVGNGKTGDLNTDNMFYTGTSGYYDERYTKDGYNFKAPFDGYYSMFLNNHSLFITYSVTQPTTIDNRKVHYYATEWKNVYEVTAQFANGTSTVTKKISGTSYSLPSNTVETGYTFIWNTSEDGTGDTVSGSQSISSSITYYEIKTPNTYTISYEGMTGATHGSSHPTSGTYDTVVNISNPTKTGYTFTGWTISNTEGNAKQGSTSDDVSTTLVTSSNMNTYFKNLRNNSGTVTFTATWSVNSYTLTLNPNVGTGSTAVIIKDKNGDTVATDESKEMTVTYDVVYDSDNKIATAKRIGYTFDGWYLNTDKIINADGTFNSTGNKCNITGDVTLSAKWIADLYSITEAGSEDVIATATFDSSILDDYDAVTRTGYTLKGYYTATSGGTKVINDDGTLVANVSGYTDSAGRWISNASASLYAQWTLNAPDYVTVTGDYATGSHTYDGNSHTLTAGHTAKPNNSVTVTYTWYKDGNAINNSNSQTIDVKDVLDAGSYTVKVSFSEVGQTTVDRTSSAATVSITKAALTATADNKSITYGDSAPSYTVTYTGFVGSETDSVVTTKATASCSAYDTTDAGKRGAGSYTITITNNSVAANYEISHNNGTLTVGKATLTATAVDVNLTYGDAVPGSYTINYSGWKYSETKDSYNDSITFPTASSEYAVTSNVGNVSITVSGGLADNYVFTNVDGKVVVAQKEVELNWTHTSDLVYNASSQKPTATATGLVNGDSCEVTVTGGQTNAGSGYTATASALSNDNYKLPAVTTTTFSIGTKQLTVTASNNSIVYGDAPAPADSTPYTITGFADPDNEDNSLTWNSAISYTYSYSQYGDVGNSYTITPVITGLANKTNNNYTFTTSNGTLTVTPKEVELSWDSITTWEYDGNSHVPTCTATGTVNSDSITVTVSGSQSAYSADNYTATASALTGDKSGNYKLPDDNTLSFNITQRTIVISWGTTSFTYDGSSKLPTATVYNIVGNENVSITTTGSQKDAGSYTVTASTITGEDAGNYVLPGANTTPFTIAKATPVISNVSDQETNWTGSERSYNETGTTTFGTLSYSNNSKTDVGTYTVTISVASSSNWNSASTTKTFTIKANIKYDGNGNTGGSVPSNQSFASGSAATNSGNLVKTGYTFAGWATTSARGLAGNVDYAADATLNSSTLNTLMATNTTIDGVKYTTLYAVWTPNKYTIQFNAGTTGINGKTISGSSPSSYTNVTYNAAYGSAFPDENTLVCNDNSYVFVGWATTLGGSLAYTQGQSITADISRDLYPGSNGGTTNLYAVWAQKYVVVFDVNGATSGSNVSKLYDKTIAEDLNPTGKGVSQPSKTGYTFSGWNTSTDGSGNNYSMSDTTDVDSTFMGDNNTVTLYAKWEKDAVDYTIIINGVTSHVYLPNSKVGNNSPSVTPSVTNSSASNSAVGTLTFYGIATDYFDANGSNQVVINASKSNYRCTGWTYDSSSKTYTAQFSLNVYTVTFAVNDAEYGTVSTASYTGVEYGKTITIDGNTVTIQGESAVTAAATSQTAQYSYAFSNWSKSSDWTTVQGNITITANFTRTTRTYTVTFAVDDAEYGTVSTASYTEVEYGKTITINGNSVTIQGKSAVTATATSANDEYTYAFSSWSKSSEWTTVQGNITITANFTRSTNVYTMTITAVNGSVSDLSIDNVPYGSSITYTTGKITINGTEITVSPSTGYKATGATWNTNASTTTTDNTYTITFVPKTYKVVLDNQSATTGGAESITATYNAAMPSIATNMPSRTGYTFGGYYTGTGGSGTQYIKADGTSNHVWDIDTDNTKLYAKWDINTYTITFAVNNDSYGSVDVASYTEIPYGTSISYLGNVLSVNDKDDVTATPKDKTKQTNYTFSNWTLSDGSWTSNSTSMPDSDLTITANFTNPATSYTITYDGNGKTSGTVGSGGTSWDWSSSALTTAEKGSFAKTGYDFAGWATSQANANAGTVAATAGSTIAYGTMQTLATAAFAANSTSPTITLYAVWTANTYKVRFNYYDGTYTEQSFTYDSSKTLTSNAKTVDNYSFAGWSLSDSSTTITYTNGQSVSNLTSTNNSTFNLYAIWKADYQILGEGSSLSWTYNNANTIKYFAYNPTTYKFYASNVSITEYTQFKLYDNTTWKEAQDVTGSPKFINGEGTANISIRYGTYNIYLDNSWKIHIDIVSIRIYLDATNYSPSGSRFAIYDGSWINMTLDSGKVYYADLTSSQYSSCKSLIIFCRMNSSGTNDWSNCSKQTYDYFLNDSGNEGKNKFTITNESTGDLGRAVGNWGYK